MTIQAASGTETLADDTLWKKLLLNRLEQLQKGTITLVDCAGTTHVFGQGQPRTHIEVLNPRFYRRVCLGETVGAGESYSDGDWRCDDLVALVQIMVSNASVLAALEGPLSSAAAFAASFMHRFRHNSISGSARNIAAHYDLSNAFFATFLDDNLMYSSAVYDSAEATLASASTAKLERLCRKLELSPRDHVLEIGTGWGGFALHAAQHHGCRVTTTTISSEQYDAAVERVRRADLADRITVLKQDYRDLEGRYDKLVSIEMVEAVGYDYLDTYFATCGKLLKDDGLFALQAITIEDRRFDQAVRSVDFIKKHIFPGSFIPSVSVLTAACARNTSQVLVSLEDIGADYARTLEAWRLAFEAQLDEVRALGFDDRFINAWRFYLAYCEGGFRERAISDVQMLFAGPAYRGQPWRAGMEGSA